MPPNTLNDVHPDERKAYIVFMLMIERWPPNLPMPTWVKIREQLKAEMAKKKMWDKEKFWGEPQ
jgi:hypothetical protein